MDPPKSVQPVSRLALQYFIHPEARYLVPNQVVCQGLCHFNAPLFRRSLGGLSGSVETMIATVTHAVTTPISHSLIRSPGVGFSAQRCASLFVHSSKPMLGNGNNAALLKARGSSKSSMLSRPAAVSIPRASLPFSACASTTCEPRVPILFNVDANKPEPLLPCRDPDGISGLSLWKSGRCWCCFQRITNNLRRISRGGVQQIFFPHPA